MNDSNKTEYLLLKNDKNAAENIPIRSDMIELFDRFFGVEYVAGDPKISVAPRNQNTTNNVHGEGFECTNIENDQDLLLEECTLIYDCKVSLTIR